MKLFVTVGAQMPFDRLIEAMEAWAAQHPEDEVFAQVGDSSFVGTASETERFLSPEAFAEACEGADAIVGHAGTGTLFAALERGKPLLVMPRRAALRETRNDHQVATAKQFQNHDGVFVAWQASELDAQLDMLREATASGTASLATPGPDAPLMQCISSFIAQPGRHFPGQGG